mgnify:CR=1 FL=1
MTKELVIVRPDDWHLHLRDEDFLPITVNESAKSFARAIIMPNLVPPITNQKMAIDYLARIKKYIKKGLKPLFKWSGGKSSEIALLKNAQNFRNNNRWRHWKGVENGLSCQYGKLKSSESDFPIRRPETFPTGWADRLRWV